MGAYTDARLEAFREATGIRPPDEEAAKIFRELQEKCISTALMLQNELSGIRDGNGNWHGCDVIGAMCKELTEAAERAWHGMPKDLKDIEYRIAENSERMRRLGIEAGLISED